MTQSLFGIRLFNFSMLDEQIDKLRELRDSYREANTAIYGEYLAQLLGEE